MSKEKRFLITTALEETWVENQPVLFLGEWCRLYSKKNRWTKMDGVVQPYHWDDRDKLYSDYVYLNALYERVLVDLSIELNHIHGVEFSLRYWRILVGPWLAYFIHILFDRWLSIESAVKNFDITNTIVKVGDEESLTPNDMNEFSHIMVMDEWNHHIYAEILRNIDGFPIEFVKNERFELSVNIGKGDLGFEARILRVYRSVARFFIRDNGVFIIASYLTRFNWFLLQLRLKQFPWYWRSVKPVRVGVDLQQRNWVLSTHSNSLFESFLLQMIPKNIPRLFLEGYQQLTAQIHCLPWPRSPKLIFTSNVLWHDTVSMAYTAEKTERGSKLVYGQHGGGYGTAKFHFAEDHEIRISDRYITWGWRDESKDNIFPVGIIKVKKRRPVGSGAGDILLVVTMNTFRYSYRLCAESAINYEEYVDRGFKFVQQLCKQIFIQTLIRTSTYETGMNIQKRWHDRFPEVKVDDGHAKIYSLFLRSRIVVQTYNQTGFLETLALGIPTVLFCDLNVTPLREAAVSHYADLKRVGIFHDTPESAAAHVNAVWGDVDAWWGSAEVQEVVAQFIKQYCYQPDNVVGIIEALLRDAIAEWPK